MVIPMSTLAALFGTEHPVALVTGAGAPRIGNCVARCLADLRTAAQGTDNLMPFILDAVKEYATLQEIMDVFRDVFGEYEEPAII